MTANRLGNWTQYSTTYTNQDVADTPYETRPSNSEGSVDHFSKRVTLRQYNDPEGYVHCDGIPTRGEYTPVDFWCVIKPPTRGAINKEGLNLVQGIDGEHEDGQWLLVFNVNHPFHEEPIELAMSSSKGFPDVIEYQGYLWRITSLLYLDVGYGEDESRKIGKALIRKWSEPTHNEISYDEDEQVGHYGIK